MAAKEKVKEEEVELEPVGPGADMEEDEIIRDTDGEPTEGSEDEDRVEARGGRDEDEEQEEERAGHAEGDDEGDPDRTRIRQRRRDERKTKKEQLRRERRELNFLRTRNETLERRQSEIDARQTNTEILAIDGRIQQLEADIRKADDVYAEAINKGDGQSAAEAQAIRDQLRDGLADYRRTRNGTIAAAKERLQPRTNGVDPEVQSRAQEWLADNPWYDTKLGDEDSTIAKAIDDRLFREKGGNAAARTDEYWEEYDKRLRKRLPHLFKNGKDRDDDHDDDLDEERGNGRTRDKDREEDKPVRRGGPRFTSGGRERPLKKGEVFVSKERREAMEEAGVWDDVETRNRYLKQYQKFDANARRNRH